MKARFTLLLFLIALCGIVVQAQQVVPAVKPVGYFAGNRFVLQHIQPLSPLSGNHPVVNPNRIETTCDSIVLTRQSQIDSFTIANPGCTSVRSLIIDGTGASPAITRLDSLKYITQVAEGLTIVHTSVTNLSALLALTQIGDTLSLEYNNSMTSIGLNNLTQLGGLYLHGLLALTSINGISNNLTSIGGAIHIDSTSLTNLAGLSGITDVNGDVGIANTPVTTLSDINTMVNIHYLYLSVDTSLTTLGLTNIHNVYGFLFDNLPHLTSLGTLTHHLINGNIGTFWMIGIPGLTDLSGLDSITNSPNFYIWANQNLSSLHGLEQLGGNVDGGISIFNNPNLTSLSQLSQITSINNGDIDLSFGSMNDLVGLGNITNVGGVIRISYCGGLINLNDLNAGLAIGNINSDTLRIFNNFQLEACSALPICNFLSGSTAVEIHDNAPGCNSMAEINASCGTLVCTTQDLKIWNGSVSDDWTDSNNWTPMGVPQPCDSVLIPEGMPEYPVLHGPTTISGLAMEPTTTLNQNGYNLTVLGNVNLVNAIIGGAPGILLIKNSNNDIHFEGSNVFPYLTIDGYYGSLEMWYTNFDNNVTIADYAGRIGVNELYGNYFNHNFSFTANAVDNSSQTYMEDGDADTVNGDVTLTVTQPVYFEVGGYPIYIGGNLTVNSDYENIPDLSFGTVDLVNGGEMHITKPGSEPLTIGFLRTSKPGGTIIPDQNIYIKYNLHFLFGVIKTDSTRLLVFNNGAGIDQTSSASYVDGPVRKIGNQSFVFPVGDSIYQSVLSISAPQNPSDTFTVRYFKRNPATDGYDTSLHPTTLNNISGSEYWQVKYNSPNGNLTAPPTAVKVTLSYDSSRSGALSSIYQLRVARWDGSQWSNEGASAVVGNIAQSFVTSLNPESSYGIFTNSFAPVRIPIITIGPSDTIGCTNHLIKIRFTIDTLMYTNNQIRAEISDSSGSFANPTFMGYDFLNHSDSLQVFIPFNLPAGHNYRIRLVSTIPPDTSVNQPRITVQRQPTSLISLNGPSVGCINTGIHKYYVTPHEAGVSYAWSLPSGGGTFTTNNDTLYVTWTTAGDRPVLVSSFNVCGFGPNSAIIHVTVSPPSPNNTPSINNIGRWLFSSIPAPNQNSLGYHWYRNDTLISGANNSSYYASAAGAFKVKYYNLCGESPASNIISFAAASIPQTITFPVIPDKVYGDSAFVPSATASSGLPVSFTLVSGPATINPLTNLLTITGTGNVTVKANQQGDNTYDTAASVSRTFAVNKASQTINFPAISDKDFATTTEFTLSATSSSGLPVSFTYVSGPATVNGNTVTLTGLGTVTVRATQAGDVNYLAAPNVDRSFCVRVSTLNSISGPNSICPGINATYTVNNVPGAAYTWRVAGGSTLSSTTNSVTTIWPAPGNYTLIVSASGSCGASSNNDSLSIVAVTSAQPDSVQNMFPANGATNQELPLLLSWIPANPNLNYTFDVYIWRADTAQPASPVVSGITVLNYTIPVSANLIYNHAYKWMVVSHNGSCATIHTGPIQQFTLRPLPDLQPFNVQAPTSAFSGQTISINWSVKNNGPGSTQTHTWTDGVFLSFDTLPNFNITPETSPISWNALQFPVRPLLIGTKPNVSSLDSGQQYSNSINFTLPLSYSVPLYAYVVSNYPNGSASPFQVTYANDTARAPQAIDVHLSPTPDLRVDTVFTPNSTFTGSTINLVYKVKNYGTLTPSSSYWYDRVYISNSPFFDANTAILLKTPKSNGSYYFNAPNAEFLHLTQLQHDSTYTVSTPVVVPNFLPSGSYYIYVATNLPNTLYEGPSGNNNVNSSLMQVFLTPTPVLTISSLTVPSTTASTTQSLGINWNIRNTGFNDNIEKNKGHNATVGNGCPSLVVSCDNNGQNCHVIGTTPGFVVNDSLSWGSSYWKDKVYLSRDTSLNIANAVYVGPYLHGGDRANAYLQDFAPLPFGSCVPVATNPAGYSLNVQNIINPQKDFPTAFNFTIPDTLSQGNYYVYVYANPEHEVFEYPGTAQIRRSSLPISIQRPDAVVSNVSAPPTAIGGQPFSLSYTVTNNGPGTVYNHFRADKIFMSSSAVFDGSAQEVTTLAYTENLPVSTGVPHTYNFTFAPSTSGTRYIYVQTNYDSSFKETNPNNNISAGLAISVTPGAPADLIVSSVQVPDTIVTVFPQLFKYTVTNNGPATTNGNWKDSIFISCSPTFNYNTSVFLVRRDHNSAITAGSSYSDSVNITMPYSFFANGCFPFTQYNNAYVFVKTNGDGGVYEATNSNNNLTGSGLRVLKNPFPDQVVASVNGADSATVGASYQVTWTDKNLGDNPGYTNYYAWFDVIYFSPDSVYNNNAVLASYYYEASPMNINQTFTDTRSAIVPNIPTGDYYLQLYTNRNSNFFESNANNNLNLKRDGSGAAKKVHVTRLPLPDLTDSIESVNSITAMGQPLNLSHRVTNIGAGSTLSGQWYDMVWLSSDYIPNNGNDVLIYSKHHTSSLAAGQYYTDTISPVVPLYIVPGNYVVIAQTGYAGTVVESNTANDISFRNITLFSPSPVDLTVEDIRKPDSVFLGYPIDTTKWTVFNNSANTAAGVSVDGIYLSQNTVVDSNAVLIGIKNKNLNMGPLSRDSLTMSPLALGVTEGNYNLLVKTDIVNNIIESDKTNNTSVSSTPIYVKVKDLPLNAVTATTMLFVPRYYKLQIPDSLLGATILVKLKSNDSLTVTNQMYIGGGYIPSAAHFDYAYGTPNYGNQQIIMSSVTSHIYYIEVNVAGAFQPNQNITLEATVLPFAIVNVDANSGGNSGNVTIRLTGSLFIPNMTAKLEKIGTTIVASSVYYSSSTIVFATFNLHGQPLGVYDVKLVKPDLSQAVLASGFSVVSPNNGGILTGGGVNTGAGDGNQPGCDPGAPAGLNSQLSIELVVPDKAFGGWPFVIQVNYINPTNNDIPMQTRVLYSLENLPVSFTQGGLSTAGPSIYLELTEQNGPPGIIRAGGSGSIILYSKAPVTFQAHHIAHYTIR